MNSFEEFTFPSSNGKDNIYSKLWLPEGRPQAVVQIVHGICEYIGRYEELAAFLVRNNIAVCGCDNLGHGRSASVPGDLGFAATNGGWGYMVSDVHKLRRIMSDRFQGIPYFIFGHSMGSFLTRTYLIKYPSDISGAIICGTGQMPAPVVLAGKALAESYIRSNGSRARSKKLFNMCFGGYNKRVKEPRTPSDWLSANTENVDRYIADPLTQFIPTNAFYRDMFGGIIFNQNKQNLRKMDTSTPVFFIAGAEDPVGGYGNGVKKAYRSFISVGCSDCSFKLYPSDRHEILNENDRKIVMRDVMSWLDNNITEDRMRSCEF